MRFIVWTRFRERGRWSGWCRDARAYPGRAAAESRMADLLCGWGDAADRLELVALPVGERPDRLSAGPVEYDLGGEGG